MTLDAPRGWKERRLKFAAEINPRPSALREDLEVTFVPMEAVRELGGMDTSLVRQVADVRQGYTAFTENDVVLAKITPCFENGKIAIARGLLNGVGFGTTELHVLRARDGFDPRWLFYLALSDDFRQLGESEMYGAGGQKRVPPSFVANFRGLFPPIEMQRAITDFLDRKTAAIDALIAKKERLIELLEEKRQALITQAVTKGLDPTAPMKDSGDLRVGSVPQHWQAERGKWLLRPYGGYAPESVVESATGVSYYKVDDLNLGGTELHLPPASRQVERHQISVLTPPAVLIPKRGAAIFTNKVRVTREDCTVDSNVMGLSVLGTHSTEYIALALWARGLRDVADVSTIPQINNKHIREIVFPVPPPEEQRAIVEYANHFTSRLDETVRAIGIHIERLREYRQALITAAVTGKIDVARYSDLREVSNP